MPEVIRISCPVVAGKYKKLSAAGKAIADRGIRRHYASCIKYGCSLDNTVIHEIINDARNGEAIYLANDQERLSSPPLPTFTSSLNFDHTVYLYRNLR